MGESQHEPSVEVGKSQEDLKLDYCGLGWLVTNDLDISWIHVYPMLINNVSQLLDLFHEKRAFF